MNHKLSINCAQYLSELAPNILFDRIFLFYSLEYVPDFKSLLHQLYCRLTPGGMIVLHTPNLNDLLLEHWNVESFKNFFYDDHSINYFSVKSIHNLLNSLKFTNYDLITEQGYSIFNHLYWFINGQPSSSPFVGSDIFLQSLKDKLALLSPSNPIRPYVKI